MATRWHDFTPKQLASILDAHLEATIRFSAEIHDGAAPDSLLALARGGDQALYHAYALAAMHLTGGSDHLWALVVALQADPIPRFAGYTLNRGLLESAARAYWLLEEDLGTGARVARALLSRVDSLWNQSRLIPKDDPAAAKMARHLQIQMTKIRAAAATHHLAVTDFPDNDPRKGQPKRIGRTTYPGPTDAVDRLLKWVFGGTGSHRWLYAYLSGFAHSTFYSFMLSHRVVTEYEDGFKQAEPLVDVTSLSATSIACAHVHSRVLRLLGKAAGKLDATVMDLDELIASVS